MDLSPSYIPISYYPLLQPHHPCVILNYILPWLAAHPSLAFLPLPSLKHGPTPVSTHFQNKYNGWISNVILFFDFPIFPLATLFIVNILFIFLGRLDSSNSFLGARSQWLQKESKTIMRKGRVLVLSYFKNRGFYIKVHCLDYHTEGKTKNANLNYVDKVCGRRSPGFSRIW